MRTRKFAQLITLCLVTILLAACAGESVPTEPVAAISEQAAEDGRTESTGDANDAAESTESEIIGNAKLNLNQATGDEYLSSIPDFGNRMVREFMEYRPYISIQQFRREMGKYVDEEQVALYEEYVYVPVNVDEADAETLKQIPGVNDDIAATLMADRPFGSNEAFLAALTEVLGEAEASAAAGFLQSP